MFNRKLFRVTLWVLVLLVLALGTPSMVSGTPQAGTFSTDVPILDGKLNDAAWQNTPRYDYMMNNFIDFASGNVANASVWYLAAPNGLYVGFEFETFISDYVGEGFYIPGFAFIVDYNNDNQIVAADDMLIDPDFVGLQLSNTTFGNIVSDWNSQRIIWAAEVGPFNTTSNFNLDIHGFIRGEVLIPGLNAKSTVQEVGIDIGILYGGASGSWDYINMIHSGSLASYTSRGDFLTDTAWAGYASQFGKVQIESYVSVDFYPPSIDFKIPTYGGTSIVRLEVVVLDDSAVSSVEFSDNGGSTWNIAVSDGGGGYHYDWDSSGFTGSEIAFRAIDTAGNVGTLKIVVDSGDLFNATKYSSIHVDNSPPVLTIVHPTAGTSVNGLVSLQVQANDISGVQSVEWRISGETTWNTMTKAVGSNIWSSTWDTSTVADGSYSLEFRASDVLSNQNSQLLTLDGMVVTSKIATTETNTITDTISPRTNTVTVTKNAKSAIGATFILALPVLTVWRRKKL